MKNNWNTGTPLSFTGSGKSKLLLCKVQWGSEIFPAVAFYNANTGEWIERNMRPVTGDVIGWQEINL